MLKHNSPNCVGFILDGNRRYAEDRALPKLVGHKQGLQNLETMIIAIEKRKISHMVCYVFSTENWQREKTEVDYLLKLFESGTKKFVARLDKEGLRDRVVIHFVGQRERFSLEMQKQMSELEKSNPKNASLTVWLLLSYGGRAEIVDGVNRAVRQGGEVTEESFQKLLWTKDMPDPDLIIRTGGEKRLSNFLTWSSVYSELIFTQTYWPEFSVEELDVCLAEYTKRSRRRGK